MNRVISGEFEGSPIKILNGTKFLYIKYDGDKYPLTGDYIKTYDFKTYDRNFITGGGMIYTVQWREGGKSVIEIDRSFSSLLVAGCETTISDIQHSKNKNKVSPFLIATLAIFILTVATFIIFIEVGKNQVSSIRPEDGEIGDRFMGYMEIEMDSEEEEPRPDPSGPANTVMNEPLPSTTQSSNSSSQNVDQHHPSDYQESYSEATNQPSTPDHGTNTNPSLPETPSTPTTKYCAYTNMYGSKTPQQLAEESPLVRQYKEAIEAAQREQRQYANSTSSSSKKKYDTAVFAEQKATNLYNKEYADMVAHYQSMLDLCD